MLPEIVSLSSDESNHDEDDPNLREELFDIYTILSEEYERNRSDVTIELLDSQIEDNCFVKIYLSQVKTLQYPFGSHVLWRRTIKSSCLIF
jgi:hypothetical protein